MEFIDTVNFWLRAVQTKSAPGDSARGESQMTHLCQTLAAAHGCSWQAGSRVELRLDAPEVAGWVRDLRALQRAGKAECGRGTLRQEIAKPTGAEWFQLKPRARIHGWEASTVGAPGCDFGSMDFDADVAQDRYGRQTVASLSFVEAVREAGLSGLAFFPLKDTGRYEGKRWFLAGSAEWVGRFGDHPWVNVEALTPHQRGERPEWRSGWSRYHLYQMRFPSKYVGTPAGELLTLLPPGEVSVELPLRLPRANLPRTHCGYGIEAWSCPPEQHRCIGSTLFVRRDAAEVLLRRGVLKWHDLRAVEIAEGATPEATAEQRAQVRAVMERDLADLRERSAAVEAGPAVPKQRRTDDLQGVLARWKAAQARPTPTARYYPWRVEDPAWEEIEAQVGSYVPREWRAVVEAAWGVEEAFDAWVNQPDRLIEHHLMVEERFAREGSEYAGKYLHVCSSGGGDWYSIPADGTDGAVKFDHEGGIIVRRWGRLAHFVEEVLVDVPMEEDQEDD